MKTITRVHVALTLAVGAAFGCAGGAASTPQTASAPGAVSNADASMPRGSRNLLTADELMRTGAVNAYMAVQKARPAWLLTRPKGSLGGGYEQLVVYVDGNRYGAASSLEQFAVTAIKEIRYLDANDATTRFGTGHGGGAVLVTLAR